MHLKNFDLNLLVALDALLSERNVTRAARRLCVTQPAVSNALQRIRVYYDDQILSRNGRDMELTPLAKSLVGPVREFVLSASSLLSADYQFDAIGTTRSFRIAMSDYCAAVLLAPLLKILTREAPEMQLEVVPLTERTAGMLVGGDIDMCVTAQDLRMLDLGAVPEQFERIGLFRDDFVCATCATNELVADELDLETYLKLPHATARFSSRQILMEEIAIRRLDLRVRVAVVVPTISSLPMIIEGTPLVISIQRRLARRLAPHFSMRFFEPPIAISELEETLYWHRRYEHDKAHQWVRAALSRATTALGDQVAARRPAGSPADLG